MNYDIVVDERRDLTCQLAWMQLAAEVSSRAYNGMQGGPVCTTFAAVRGKAGGPPKLRGLGKYIYGLPDLTPQQREQVDGGTLIADRCAWIARQLCD